MATFDDLKFNPHPAYPSTGVGARISFPNGYGASVVRFPYSYGGDEGLYELAVLNADGRLTYETPITSDVEGHLTPDDVTGLLARIEALPEPAPAHIQPTHGLRYMRCHKIRAHRQEPTGLPLLRSRANLALSRAQLASLARSRRDRGASERMRGTRQTNAT